METKTWNWDIYSDRASQRVEKLTVGGDVVLGLAPMVDRPEGNGHDFGDVEKVGVAR